MTQIWRLNQRCCIWGQVGDFDGWYSQGSGWPGMLSNIARISKDGPLPARYILTSETKKSSCGVYLLPSKLQGQQLIDKGRPDHKTRLCCTMRELACHFLPGILVLASPPNKCPLWHFLFRSKTLSSALKAYSGTYPFSSVIIFMASGNSSAASQSEAAASPVIWTFFFFF